MCILKNNISETPKMIMFKITGGTKVCSKNFVSSYYKMPFNRRITRLLSGNIPAVFPQCKEGGGRIESIICPDMTPPSQLPQCYCYETATTDEHDGEQNEEESSSAEE